MSALFSVAANANWTVKSWSTSMNGVMPSSDVQNSILGSAEVYLVSFVGFG